MGIQENKNQFDGESLPANFTRLVKAFRMKKAEEIWEYFLQRVTVSVSVSATEDSDSEEETVVVTSVVAQMQGVVAPVVAPVVGPVVAPVVAPASDSESEPENEVVAPAAALAVAAPSRGTEVRARLTSLVLNIVPSTTYPPEILAHLAELEACIVPS
jgi:hypothetical protein